MKVKKSEKLVVKSVFKSEDIQMRKNDFNEKKRGTNLTYNRIQLLL